MANVIERLDELKRSLQTLVSSIDVDALPGPSATSMLTTLVSLEHSTSAAIRRVALRVESSNAHVPLGHRDAIGLVSSIAGIDRSSAASMLTTARRVASLPEVAAADSSGSLSTAQVTAVAHGAAAAPQRQSELLSTARTASSRALADRCRQVGSSSAADEATRDRQRRSQRGCWFSTDDLGMVRLFARLTPEEGAPLRQAFQAQRSRTFRQAQGAGRREAHCQYDADALLQLFEASFDGATPFEKSGGERDDPAPKGPRAQRSNRRPRVQVVVDLEALRRGHAGDGEACEIPGVGSVSVRTARELLGDCWLQLLIKHGVDVTTVTSTTRWVPKPVRDALAFRDRRCQVPGCEEPELLELDHVQQFAHGNATSFENLMVLCWFHHRKKTNEGFHVEGPPGERRWVGRDGTVFAQDRPAPDDGSSIESPSIEEARRADDLSMKHPVDEAIEAAHSAAPGSSNVQHGSGPQWQTDTPGARSRKEEAPKLFDPG